MRVTVAEARRNFAEIIHRVGDGATIILDSRGHDVAAMVPVQVALQRAALAKQTLSMHQIQQAAKLASTVPGISEIILFGSYARGDANGRSDVDILLVISSKCDYDAVYDAAEKVLVRALRPKVLELIGVTEQDWKEASTDGSLLGSVLQEGRVLFHG